MTHWKIGMNHQGEVWIENKGCSYIHKALLFLEECHFSSSICLIFCQGFMKQRQLKVRFRTMYWLQLSGIGDSICIEDYICMKSKCFEVQVVFYQTNLIFHQLSQNITKYFTLISLSSTCLEHVQSILSRQN